MALDALDKIYIDQAMERNRIQFRSDMEPFFRELQKENRDHMMALKEGFQDQIKAIAELVADKPGREEVREIAREEARYLIRDDFNRYIVPNIKEVVRAEVAPLRNEMQELKSEMVALRKDSNRHDREIKALKLKHA